MLIALDYDGTITLAPSFWWRFVHDALKDGHKVVIATMRYEDELNEVEEFLTGLQVPIVATGCQAKQHYLHNMGIKPDVWIDDMPLWLFVDSN